VSVGVDGRDGAGGVSGVDSEGDDGGDGGDDGDNGVIECGDGGGECDNGDDSDEDGGGSDSGDGVDDSDVWGWCVWVSAMVVMCVSSDACVSVGQRRADAACPAKIHPQGPVDRQHT
jgi:hypothetical protein